MNGLRRSLPLFAVLAAAPLGAPAFDRTEPPAGSAPSVVRHDATAAMRRTTDGALAMTNLDAEIERLEANAGRPVEASARLVSALVTRGRFRGSIADYERAALIADRVVEAAPNDARALAAAAQAAATFHRFDAAEDLLDRADAVDPATTGAREGARAAIAQARGDFDAARPARAAAIATKPDVLSIGAVASLEAGRGNTEQAKLLFEAARLAYRDVSPFPLAWLDFEEGAMWQRAERWDLAHERFAAAVRRLPQYAAARGHLAEVAAAAGDLDEAIALLEPLAETSDDPDYAAQLARVLIDAGRAREAERWIDRAHRRFTELLRAYPEAYAEHAAEFYAAAGAAPERAWELAELNVRLRHTPAACTLAHEAALAARAEQRACRLEKCREQLRERCGGAA